MDSFLTGLLKFRHPLGSLVGFGAAALLSLFLLGKAGEQHPNLLTLYALLAGVLGAGIGGAAVFGFEAAWRASRPLRARVDARAAKRDASSRLSRISQNAKAFIADRLDAQSHANPSLEFEWDQMHLAEELVDNDLARKNWHNPLVVTLSDNAWSCICDDPERFGLARRRVRMLRGRDALTVFKRL